MSEIKLHNDRAIEITVQLLKEHGIKYIVISPGGTNIQLVKMVQNDPFFTCYSVVDERSAIYFAIGLYLQTGKIIATSCTSAQATRNYMPGLTEAHYKRVPILAITMEKHKRFVGQEYMQAPNQVSVPKDCVKNTYELPFVSSVHDEYHCVRLVNEAILELTHNGFGPVQLCIPRLDFKTSEFGVSTRKIGIFQHGNFPHYSFGTKKVLILIGEHRRFSPKEKEAIERFSNSVNCVIYCNNLSNYHGNYCIFANLEFTCMDIFTFAKEYAPDILITIGGQTGDYPIYLMLSKPELKQVEHWRVNEDGKIIDTYDKLTRVYQSDLISFFNFYSEEVETSHDYYYLFNKLIKKTNKDIELPFSNAYLAQRISNILPDNSVVQFSILNSLRVWNLFKLSESITCYSNVGAFGIDGGLSTLIGQSVATDNLCFMIIGDLASYYDMNSLGIRHIKDNVRILLINNNGGVEFKLNDSNHTQVDKFIAASNHFKNARGWADTCGFRYIGVSNKEELEECINEFVSPSNKSIVLEAFILDSDDYKGYRLLLDKNRDISLSEVFKNKIKKIVK